MKVKKHNKNDSSPYAMIYERPFAVQEASKRLCANVIHITQDWKSRVIMLTSSNSGEGKSVISINLANDLTAAGKKTLLLSCDMWNDSTSEYLKSARGEQTGLLQLMNGKNKYSECIHNSQGLYYIGSGKTDNDEMKRMNPEITKRILAFLSEQFDYVVCDCPPVNAVADTIVLSTLCDGVLFVVRRGIATKSEVQRSRNALSQVGANVIGCVFNDAPTESRGYGYYYGRAYKR